MAVIPTKSGDRVASSTFETRRAESDAAAGANFAALFGTAWAQQSRMNGNGVASEASSMASRSLNTTAERGAVNAGTTSTATAPAAREAEGPASREADATPASAEKAPDAPVKNTGNRNREQTRAEQPPQDAKTANEDQATASEARTDGRQPRTASVLPASDPLLTRRLGRLQARSGNPAAEGATTGITDATAGTGAATASASAVTRQGRKAAATEAGADAGSVDPTLKTPGTGTVAVTAEAAQPTATATPDAMAGAEAVATALSTGGSGTQTNTGDGQSGNRGQAAADPLAGTRNGAASGAADSKDAFIKAAGATATEVAAGIKPGSQAKPEAAPGIPAVPADSTAPGKAEGLAGALSTAALPTEAAAVSAGKSTGSPATAVAQTGATRTATPDTSAIRSTVGDTALPRASAVAADSNRTIDTAAPAGTDGLRTANAPVAAGPRLAVDRAAAASALQPASQTGALPAMGSLDAGSLRMQGETGTADALPAVSAGGNNAPVPLVNANGISAFQSVAAQDEPPKLVIATPITEPGFADELFDTVQLVSTRGLQSVEINIAPAELGPIKLKVEMNGNQADVSFEAAHEQTRTLLAEAVPALREQLSQSGIDLRHANVDRNAAWAGAGGSGGQQTQNQESRSGRDGNGSGARDDRGVGDVRGGRGSTEATAAVQRVRNALLDTYA